MRTLDVAAFLSVLAMGCGGVDVETIDAGPTRADANSSSDASADPDAAAEVAVDLIDNLEDGDNRILDASGRTGNWYVLNDGTEGGSQKPFPDFAPTVGGAGGSGYSAQTSGSGFDDWGAKVGLYLNYPDKTADPLPYDLSGYTGLQFRARGNNITFRPVIVTTALLDEAHGGACVQMPPAELCDDYYGQRTTLTEDWVLYRLPFSEMTQAGWGKRANLDLTTTTAIEFEMENVASFDIAVDDVAFYTAEEP